MTKNNPDTVTPLKEKKKDDSSVDYGALDASKKNRVPSISPEKVFEVKYSDCYGNHYDLEELRRLAIFDILAYGMLSEKQLLEIQKTIDRFKDLSLEEIDEQRNEAIMKNKKYTDPEYKLISYHFLKNDKLNVVYSHKSEYNAFIMLLANGSINETVTHYNNKIANFKKGNSPAPKDWIIRISLLNQILQKKHQQDVIQK